MPRSVFHRTGILEGLRKGSSCMPPVCNWPLSSWRHPLPQYSSDPNFLGVQPSGRLGWVAQQWQGGKYVSYRCLFLVPASISACVDQGYGYHRVSSCLEPNGSPTQNSGRWKACCKAESHSFLF